MLRKLILLFAAIIFAVCLFVLSTASIEKTTDTLQYSISFSDSSGLNGILSLVSSSFETGNYLIKFKPDVAIIGNSTVSYAPFAIFVAASIVILFISEIISNIISEKSNLSCNNVDDFFSIPIDIRIQKAMATKTGGLK